MYETSIRKSGRKDGILYVQHTKLLSSDMANLPDNLTTLLDKVWQNTKPTSIFLYGSMARDDFEADSDFEIGVVYKQSNKWSRQQLKDLHNYSNVKIYPFIEEELHEGIIDTPFPKSIYLHSLLSSSQHLYGLKLDKLIKVADITNNDLFEAIGFCLGRAYSAVVSSRQNDWVAVRDGFTKSFLGGMQLLIYLRSGKLLFSYKEIYNQALEMIDSGYVDLLTHVMEVRSNKSNTDVRFLYNNIAFLNRVVLKSIASRASTL